MQLAETYICCNTGLNEGGYSRNIAFQLVLKQSCKFLLPVLLKLYPTKNLWRKKVRKICHIKKSKLTIKHGS